MLEVIVTSAAEALEAERGGGGRLEVVRDLAQGGLTPALETVREIRAAVSLPLRVMVRETADYHVHGADDLARMRDAAAAFGALRVEGLVVGFASEGSADLDPVATILEAAPRTRATFHRAFESLADPLRQIERLKALPQIDRILTNGGPGSWQERAWRLEQWRAAAAPEITVLVGGGLDLETMAGLARETGIEEFHVGAAARDNGAVSADRVSRLETALTR